MSAYVPQPGRRRTPPQALIGDRPFVELYPQWQMICDYFERAIAEEVESGRTPRAYLADLNRFLNFFTDHVTRVPQLGVRVEQVNDVVAHVHDEFFGVGLIAPWLEDPDVEDIICDGWQALDVYKRGEKHRVSPTPWVDNADLLRWQQRVLGSQHKTISAHNPVESGQLPDGSRFIFLCPPVVQSCSFAIRKHRTERFAADAYMQSGVAPAEFFADLRRWVTQRQTILVSGATGSGKTTMLNFLGSLIDSWERVLVIEDTPELQLPHDRAHSLAAVMREARGAQGDDRAITLAHLIRYALRMKPDRIVVGEVRGAEAFDMLQAFNTGHDGGLSTIHANNPNDAIMRIESLAAAANANVLTSSLQDQIGATIGIIVQLKQLPRSSRRAVVDVAQVLHPAKVLDRAVLDESFCVRDGRVYLRTLWRWDQRQAELIKHADPVPLAGQYFGV